jgi:hypothetical protein
MIFFSEKQLLSNFTMATVQTLLHFTRLNDYGQYAVTDGLFRDPLLLIGEAVMCQQGKDI